MTVYLYRLVPTMLYTVWGCGTVLRHLGSGLVWDRTYQDMFGQPCTSSAWYNLLFINNFNDSGDMVRYAMHCTNV